MYGIFWSYGVIQDYYTYKKINHKNTLMRFYYALIFLYLYLSSLGIHVIHIPKFFHAAYFNRRLQMKIYWYKSAEFSSIQMYLMRYKGVTSVHKVCMYLHVLLAYDI